MRSPVGFVFFATTIVLDSHVFVPERRATGVVGVQNRDVFSAPGEASGDEHGCRRFSDAAFDVGDRDKNRAFQHAVFSSVHVSAAKVEAWDALFLCGHIQCSRGAFFCGTSSPHQQENNTMRK